MPFLQFEHEDGSKLLLRLSEPRLTADLQQDMTEKQDVRFSPEGMRLIAHDLKHSPEESPCFFSWQRWEILFESNRSLKNITLLLNGLLVLVSDKPSSSLFGSFVLQGAIGYSDLELVIEEEQQIFSLALEVFPQKLRYKTDFRDMLEDLHRFLYGLAFAEMRRTYVLLDTDVSRASSLSSWIVQLRTLMQDVDRALNRILQQPNRRRKTGQQVLPVRKVRQSPPNLASWIGIHPQYLEPDVGQGWFVKEGIRLSHLPTKERALSYDTAENRFIVWAIRQMKDRLDRWENVLSPRQKNKDVRVSWMIDLKRFKRRLKQKLAHPYLQDIGSFWQQQQLSTVLMMGPGYREFYKRFLLLQKGLSLSDSGIFQMDIKEIHTLYEYWCLLRVIQLLQEIPDYELLSQSIIVQQPDQLFVKLRKGEDSQVVFRHKKYQTHVRLWFNRTFGEGDSYTFKQIPDMVLEIEKAGYEQAFRYLIEVKYQFDRGSRAYPRTKVPYGPPLEAIAQLHRYRDAIVSQKESHVTHQSAWKIIGGIVLFPFPDPEDDFVQHPFYQSLAKVDIGAIPLHPGPYHTHELLRSWLHRRIDFSPEALYEQVIEYDRREQQERIEDMHTAMLILVLPADLYEDGAARQKIHLMRNQYCWFEPDSDLPDSCQDLGFFAPHLKKIVAFARNVQTRSVSADWLISKGLSPELLGETPTFRWFEWSQLEGCSIPFANFPSTQYFYTSRYGFDLARQSRRNTPLWMPSYLWFRVWQEIRKLSDKIEILPPSEDKVLQLSFVWKRYRFHVQESDSQESMLIQHGSGFSVRWKLSDPLRELLTDFYRKTRRKKT